MYKYTVHVFKSQTKIYKDSYTYYTKECTVCYIATHILTMRSSKTHGFLSSEYVISQLEILFQFYCDSKLIYFLFLQVLLLSLLSYVNAHLVISTLKSDNQVFNKNIILCAYNSFIFVKSYLYSALEHCEWVIFSFIYTFDLLFTSV